MAKTSFVDAVLGSKRFDSTDLIFPETYHTCFINQDSSLPFIKNAVSRNGKPALLLSAEEQTTLSDPLKHTLICKFSTRMPNFELIRKHFESLKLRGPWRLGILDFRHVMIKVELELDYTFLFTKKLHRIENVLVKFLKWTADFDFRSEPPIAPVWIKFPGLKLHLFHKQILFSLATVFGKPLKLDYPTFNLSRPSAARVLVEMDITFSYADEIWIGSHDEGYWQEVVIDSKPFYCSKCRIFGHYLENYFITNPQLRQDLASRENEFGLNEKENPVIEIEGSILAKEGLNLHSSRLVHNDFRMTPVNAITANAIAHHGGISDCSIVQDLPAVPLFEGPFTDLVASAGLLSVSTNLEGTAAALEVPFSTQEVPIVTVPTNNIAVLGSTINAIIQQPKLGSEVSSVEAGLYHPGADFSAVNELENNNTASIVLADPISESGATISVTVPTCSNTKTAAANKILSHSLVGSANPFAAALSTKLFKHAPAYTTKPNFANDLNSEQGNTDSESYETYTGSYREDDMQLNEACKEVLEEWQEEWEFQISKKKAKGD